MPYHPSTIPPDTLLSSWIFYWSILYFIVKYFATSIPLDFWNPTFAILFALTYQFYAFIQVLLNVRPFHRLPLILAKFFTLTFFIKLLPLYLVIGSPPLVNILDRIAANMRQGIPAFIGVFLIYFVYITQQKLDIFEIYDDFTNSYIDDDNRVPPYQLVNNSFFFNK